MFQPYCEWLPSIWIISRVVNLILTSKKWSRSKSSVISCGRKIIRFLGLWKRVVVFSWIRRIVREKSMTQWHKSGRSLRSNRFQLGPTWHPSSGYRPGTSRYFFQYPRTSTFVLPGTISGKSMKIISRYFSMKSKIPENINFLFPRYCTVQSVPGNNSQKRLDFFQVYLEVPGRYPEEGCHVDWDRPLFLLPIEPFLEIKKFVFAFLHFLVPSRFLSSFSFTTDEH